MAAPAGVAPESESGRRGGSRHCGEGRAHGRAPAAAAAAASMLQRGAQFLPARRLPLSEHAGAGSLGAGPALVATAAREPGCQPLV